MMAQITKISAEVLTQEVGGEIVILDLKSESYFGLDEVFQKAIEAPDIENEHGVPWQVVYGISNNTRAFWSLSNARRVLGYRPEDDSEVKFAGDIRGFLAGPGATGGVGRVGLA